MNESKESNASNASTNERLPIRAARGNALTAGSWQTEAPCAC